MEIHNGQKEVLLTRAGILGRNTGILASFNYMDWLIVDENGFHYICHAAATAHGISSPPRRKDRKDENRIGQRK